MITPVEDKQLTPETNLGLSLFVGVVLSLGALLLFYLLVTGVTTNAPIVQVDQNIALTLHSIVSPQLLNLMIAFSLLGLQVLWLVVIIIALYYAVRRQWNHLTVWIAAVAGIEILTEILKLFIRRPRPVFTNPFVTALQFSFPSGHASVSLVVYGLIAYLMMSAVNVGWKRTLILTTMTVLILMIGFSRIYLGVHFFSDVIAGYVIGVICLAICINALGILQRHHKR